MITEFEEFSNADAITKLRHWLIKKIAGNHVVILNAKLTIIESPDSGTFLKVKDVDGCLLLNNSFGNTNYFGVLNIIEIQQNEMRQVR